MGSRASDKTEFGFPIQNREEMVGISLSPTPIYLPTSLSFFFRKKTVDFHRVSNRRVLCSLHVSFVCSLPLTMKQAQKSFPKVVVMRRSSPSSSTNLQDLSFLHPNEEGDIGHCILDLFNLCSGEIIEIPSDQFDILLSWVAHQLELPTEGSHHDLLQGINALLLRRNLTKHSFDSAPDLFKYFYLLIMDHISSRHNERKKERGRVRRVLDREGPVSSVGSSPQKRRRSMRIQNNSIKDIHDALSVLLQEQYGVLSEFASISMAVVLKDGASVRVRHEFRLPSSNEGDNSIERAYLLSTANNFFDHMNTTIENTGIASLEHVIAELCDLSGTIYQSKKVIA